MQIDIYIQIRFALEEIPQTRIAQSVVLGGNFCVKCHEVVGLILLPNLPEKNRLTKDYEK
jgi:hypothetical protein